MIQSETGTSLNDVTNSFALLLPACKQLQQLSLRLSGMLYEETCFYLLPLLNPRQHTASSVDCSMQDVVGLNKAYLYLLLSSSKHAGPSAHFLETDDSAHR
jgi:hypothetical protein